MIFMNVWLEGWKKGKLVGPRNFLHEPIKNQSPKFGEIYGEKIRMGRSKGKMTHLPLTVPTVIWFKKKKKKSNWQALFFCFISLCLFTSYYPVRLTFHISRQLFFFFFSFFIISFSFARCFISCGFFCYNTKTPFELWVKIKSTPDLLIWK